MKVTKEMKETLESKDKSFYDLFDQLLPLYWKNENEVPENVRHILAINKWINCVHACNDLAYHILVSRKYQREAQKRLTHEISFHEYLSSSYPSFDKPKANLELQWAGKCSYTSTGYYPAKCKEIYGVDTDGWMNKVYWGDNLQVMLHLLKDFRGKVDLIYIDPPFDSKSDYKKTISLRGRKSKLTNSSFEETQYGDIWTSEEYLQFMYERLILCRELLSDTGSIYVHLDRHKVHYLRCIMDEIFGKTNFINEVIWYYRRWNIESTSFASNHDTILMFQKGRKHTYNQLYIPKSEKSSAQGKSWKSVIGEDGIRRSVQTDEPTKGVPMPDVWDISMINPVAKERTEIGYPTQKPEALLERIIKASSNSGDLVFDGFMGSGTTQAVAMKLGRRFLGADINKGAIQTTTKRLLKCAEGLKNNTDKTYYTGIEVYNVNDYSFNPPVFKNDSVVNVEIVTENHIRGRALKITHFYPTHLLQKLNLNIEDVVEWRELVDSIFIDWNYNGVTFCPEIKDIPDIKSLVQGTYLIPPKATLIYIKITDLINESWENTLDLSNFICS